MNAARWNYIKSLAPPAPRFLHVSKSFSTQEQIDDAGIITVVQVASRSSTYNIGRNQAKRERRGIYN